MPGTWLDDLQSGLNLVRNSKRELNELATLLHEAGNERVARRLGEIVRDLHLAQGLLDRGTGNVLNRYVKSSEEATQNMVLAAIAAVTRTKET